MQVCVWVWVSNFYTPEIPSVNRWQITEKWTGRAMRRWVICLSFLVQVLSFILGFRNLCIIWMTTVWFLHKGVQLQVIQWLGNLIYICLLIILLLQQCRTTPNDRRSTWNDAERRVYYSQVVLCCLTVIQSRSAVVHGRSALFNSFQEYLSHLEVLSHA